MEVRGPMLTLLLEVLGCGELCILGECRPVSRFYWWAPRKMDSWFRAGDTGSIASSNLPNSLDCLKEVPMIELHMFLSPSGRKLQIWMKQEAYFRFFRPCICLWLPCDYCDPRMSCFVPETVESYPEELLLHLFDRHGRQSWLSAGLFKQIRWSLQCSKHVHKIFWLKKNVFAKIARLFGLFWVTVSSSNLSSFVVSNASFQNWRTCVVHEVQPWFQQLLFLESCSLEQLIMVTKFGIVTELVQFEIMIWSSCSMTLWIEGDMFCTSSFIPSWDNHFCKSRLFDSFFKMRQEIVLTKKVQIC